MSKYRALLTAAPLPHRKDWFRIHPKHLARLRWYLNVPDPDALDDGDAAEFDAIDGALSACADRRSVGEILLPVVRNGPVAGGWYCATITNTGEIADYLTIDDVLSLALREHQGKLTPTEAKDAERMLRWAQKSFEACYGQYSHALRTGPELPLYHQKSAYRVSLEKWKADTAVSARDRAALTHRFSHRAPDRLPRKQRKQWHETNDALRGDEVALRAYFARDDFQSRILAVASALGSWSEYASVIGSPPYTARLLEIDALRSRGADSREERQFYGEISARVCEQLEAEYSRFKQTRKGNRPPRYLEFSVDEVARGLGQSRDTVERLIASGSLKYSKPGVVRLYIADARRFARKWFKRVELTGICNRTDRELAEWFEARAKATIEAMPWPCVSEDKESTRRDCSRAPRDDVLITARVSDTEIKDTAWRRSIKADKFNRIASKLAEIAPHAQRHNGDGSQFTRKWIPSESDHIRAADLAGGCTIVNGSKGRKGLAAPVDDGKFTVDDLAEFYRPIGSAQLRKLLQAHGCPGAERARARLPVSWLRSKAGEAFKAAIPTLTEKK